MDSVDTDLVDDNVHYTRVTDVLTPFSGLDRINPGVVHNAAQRGTRVHTACEAIIKGIDLLEHDWEIKPYMDSFLKWWPAPITVVAIEKRFYCDEMALTGQVDLIIEDQGKLGILDFKTSYRPSKTWPLQGSAYKYLARKSGYDIQTIQFLHLKRDGTEPVMYHYEDQWDMYKKCLDVYNYFFKRKS